ncbi:MAG: electron transport complex subunit RsxA [Firmicutes bacterium]|jgi:Na+-translocating ferredoxin:NAD+ oxidoreductase subunit A|nr:electron transport complex subunit RsxA [Bacillota bacterium]MBO2521215.1 electron transport complex subunit RsxA [Bacillota bacterium]
MTELLLLFVGSALVNNFLLTRFLGICPFLGVTRELKAGVSMGIAVTSVMVASVLVLWPLYNLALAPLGLGFLQNMLFILVIAALVQFLEMVIKRAFPSLYTAFGIYLPLITTNCAILGLALLMVGNEYTFLQSLVFAVGSGAGVTLAMGMMAAIREELEFADVPQSLQGPGIALITAGIMALSFMGFAGLGS